MSLVSELYLFGSQARGDQKLVDWIYLNFTVMYFTLCSMSMISVGLC
jgi:hypothetical protein